MQSRTQTSSLVLLIIAILLLANCASPPPTHSSLPLTPPPLTAQAVRVGPLLPEPTSTLTSTSTVSVTAALTVTPALTVIPPLTGTIVLTPTPAAILLPTVTPTRLPGIVLLPTPTATPPQSAASLTPTAAVATTDLITQAIVITQTAPITAGAVTTESAGASPPASLTATLPLPPSYQAQGTFSSQTVFTDSTTAEQQGSFTILQTAATNAYGANQHYTLRTQRAVGELEEINVYQIDNYVAVNYTGGDWMLVRRDQGSNIVRAIQPITDLALLFPRIIDQAEFVGQEEIAGVPSLRYRLDDPTGQGARLIQPMLALTGEIRALTLDVWIAVPGGYVAAYNFQVQLAGARVLDANRDEVRADQAVMWTYQITPDEEAQPILWPTNAPTPDAFPIPGFAPGDFPIPPDTELLSLVGGVPDLISKLTPQEIDSFYRSELFTRGWTVEGESGLLRCSKEGTSFQLLITDEAETGGSHITVLPGELVG
ncbi:MAG: hypothetical protein IT328_08975 [Caldilineaceae bacterium]|nr:hypothetical protein [Caldilineaceae bacterium]